jgi:clan AA aspartic protease
MGTVYATITIKNQFDVRCVLNGYKKEDEIRQATVESVVDTGAITLFITEELRQQLGLEILDERPATVANGQVEMVKRTDAVEVHWEDRSMVCSPRVVPGGNEILLGVIPMEDMDLIVDPAREALVGAHGDKILHRLPSVRWR